MKVPFDQQILIFFDHWPITNTTPGLAAAWPCGAWPRCGFPMPSRLFTETLPQPQLTSDLSRDSGPLVSDSCKYNMLTCIFQRQREREKRIWNVFSNISIYILQKRAAEFGYQILRFYIVYIYSLFCRINVKTEYCDWDPILNTFYPRPFISQYPKCFLCWTSSE